MAQSKTKRIKRSIRSNPLRSEASKRTEVEVVKKTLNQPRTIRQPADQGGGKNKIMTTKDMLEKAKRELADLTGFKSPSAVGFKKEGTDLVATIEVIEKNSIPDGMDILGAYEVRVDDSGKIISYKRTDLRKRVDTTFDKEI